MILLGRIDIFISLDSYKRRPSSRTWIVTLASDLFVYPPLTLNQPDHNQMYGNTWWSFLQTLEVHILTSSVYTTFNQPDDSNEWWSEHFDHLSFLLFGVDEKKLQQRWHLYAMRGSRHSLSPADVLPADLPKRECLWFETRRQLFERSNATLSQKVLGRLLVFMNHSICVFQQTHSRTSLVWSSFSSEVDCQRSERCRLPRTRLDCTSC